MSQPGISRKNGVDPGTTLAQKQAVNVQILAEVAGLVALAAVLNLFKFFWLPQGGSITLASMVPLFLLALRRGWRVGVVSGVIFSLVVMVQEPGNIYNPVQAALDYPVAFGALGLAGFFRKTPILGVVVGIAGRFVAHFISGILFFAIFAEQAGFSNVVVYSLYYNASYMGPELAISAIVTWTLVHFKALELYL